jgi:hypothetical protein
LCLSAAVIAETKNAAGGQTTNPGGSNLESECTLVKEEQIPSDKEN